VVEPLDGDIVDSILKLSPLVVYGEQGVGRTIFLYQLAFSLLHRDFNVFFLTSDISYRVIKSYLRIATDFYTPRIYVFAEFSLSDRIRCLTDVLEDIIMSSPSKVSIIFDDFLPTHIQLSRMIDETTSCSIAKLLFWLNFLARSKFCYPIVCSVLENTKSSLPFKARFYRSYGFNFLRIYKISRIRIFRKSIIPGERVGQEDQEDLGMAIITNNGFIFEKTKATS